MNIYDIIIVILLTIIVCLLYINIRGIYEIICFMRDCYKTDLNKDSGKNLNEINIKKSIPMISMAYIDEEKKKKEDEEKKKDIYPNGRDI